MIANQVAGFFGSPYTAPLSDFESIQTVTVGSGGSSSIEFTSIAGTWKHLQLRIMAINPSVTGWVDLKANSSTASAASHLIQGNGSAANAYANVGNAYSSSIFQGGGSSSNPAVAVVDILDYANTNKYKTFRTLSGIDQNGSGNIWLFSNLFASTSAITNLTITQQGGSFAQYSSFALYGVK